MIHWTIIPILIGLAFSFGAYLLAVRSLFITLRLLQKEAILETRTNPKDPGFDSEYS